MQRLPGQIRLTYNKTIILMKNSIYFYVICLGVSIYNGMGRIFE